MKRSDARAFGADYSAGEYTARQLTEYNRIPGVTPIQFVYRYIGYPTNPKCISHYSGRYREFWEAGIPVGLFHQVAYRDFEGGYDRGREHAQVALADARRVGWAGESHIIACFDRYMVKANFPTIPLGVVRDYVRGFRSVLGDNTGYYGFFDTMGPAVAEQWCDFYMQCGAREHHIRGIDAWQENNEQPIVMGMQTDRLELYRDMSEVFGMALSDDEVNRIAKAVWMHGATAIVGESGTTDESGNPIWSSTMENMIASLWGEEFNSTQNYPWASGAARRRSEAREIATLELLAQISSDPGITMERLKEALDESLAGLIELTGEIRIDRAPRPPADV